MDMFSPESWERLDEEKRNRFWSQHNQTLRSAQERAPVTAMHTKGEFVDSAGFTPNEDYRPGEEAEAPATPATSPSQAKQGGSSVARMLSEFVAREAPADPNTLPNVLRKLHNSLWVLEL